MSVQIVHVKRRVSASGKSGRAPRGKPSLDENQLKNYLMLGAKDADLAAMLDVSVSTLRRYFGQTLKKLRAQRRKNIGTMVWNKALKGNTALITWLANNELKNQEEAVEHAPKRRKRFDFRRFAEEFDKFHDAPQQAGERNAQADGSGQPIRPDHPDAQAGDLPDPPDE